MQPEAPRLACDEVGRRYGRECRFGTHEQDKAGIATMRPSRFVVATTPPRGDRNVSRELRIHLSDNAIDPRTCGKPMDSSRSASAAGRQIGIPDLLTSPLNRSGFGSTPGLNVVSRTMIRTCFVSATALSGIISEAYCSRRSSISSCIYVHFITLGDLNWTTYKTRVGPYQSPDTTTPLVAPSLDRTLSPILNLK